MNRLSNIAYSALNTLLDVTGDVVPLASAFVATHGCGKGTLTYLDHFVEFGMNIWRSPCRIFEPTL